MSKSPVDKNDAQWREQLTDEQFHVLREKGTERPFTGAYWDTTEAGTYSCAGCGEALYSSEDKFDAGCGWPSFTQAVDKEVLDTAVDASLSRVRTELLCRRCGGHLGHVFPDGPAPTGMRHCINSVSLVFEPEE
jgi:peptide-methionine (R)-S-oxide reductase